MQKVWRKSTYSTVQNCVEVAIGDTEVSVRNSRFPDGPQLDYTPEEWNAFIAGAKDGQFNN